MTSHGPQGSLCPILVIRATPSTFSAAFLQREAESSGHSVAPSAVLRPGEWEPGLRVWRATDCLVASEPQFPPGVRSWRGNI